MNVLIYNYQEESKELLFELRKIPGISIYFAFSDHELEEIRANTEPEIIFSDDQHIKWSSNSQNRSPSIYIIDHNSSKFKLIENITNKQVSIKQIF